MNLWNHLLFGVSNQFSMQTTLLFQSNDLNEFIWKFVGGIFVFEFVFRFFLSKIIFKLSIYPFIFILFVVFWNFQFFFSVSVETLPYWKTKKNPKFAHTHNNLVSVLFETCSFFKFTFFHSFFRFNLLNFSFCSPSSFEDLILISLKTTRTRWW